MSNIIIPDKINTGIVDWTGRALSHDEIYGNAKESNDTTTYSLPIGGDYRYYKVKLEDKWYVGWVKNRPIPRNTTAILYKTAFEMMFGTKAANDGTNKQQWEKVTHNAVGSVIIKEQGTTLDTKALPNANDGEKFQKLTKEFEKHNI